MFVCMCICMSVCLSECLSECLSVCMYVCMYVCTYIHMYGCMSVYECMYVCMDVAYICMHVCMHACMYVIYRIYNFFFFLKKKICVAGLGRREVALKSAWVSLSQLEFPWSFLNVVWPKFKNSNLKNSDRWSRMRAVWAFFSTVAGILLK